MAHPDGCREIRAMVLASLPVPPMPAIGSKRLEDEHGTVESCSSTFCSFDMIAHMLNVSAKHHKQEVNERRQSLQRGAEQGLFERIDLMAEPPTDLAQVWGLFSEFTREYVKSYTLQDVVDLRFGDPSRVPKGSLVWHVALDQAKAHDNLFGDLNRLGGAATDSMTYEDLVLRCAKRIWIAGLPVPNAQAADPTAGEAQCSPE